MAEEHRLPRTAECRPHSVGPREVRGEGTSAGTGLAAAGFSTVSPMEDAGVSWHHVCKRGDHAQFTSSPIG